MEAIYIILGILVVVAVAVIVIYNGLVTIKTRVDEAWSDITVQLRRRYDLIPNLVNTVKGYAQHEDTVFTKVTEARASALNAKGVKETAEAEGQFASALKSLFAVSENYPQLKANEGFLKLQDELSDTEDKIMAARRFYNGAARDLNIKIAKFPGNIIANMFGFTAREFFETDDKAAEQPVAVKF
jgi:LemA protein